MNKSIVPSFFVVGAQKAGTTTLHDWLKASPEIALPEIKETHFFSDERRYKLGLDWYKKQFSENAWRCGCIIGEIDPDYMFFPEAAMRIQEVIKRPRLIVLLREPLKRAYSQYLMTCRRGYEELPFAKALNAEKHRCGDGNRYHLDNHSYLARGLYVDQILRLKRVFPFSEILFLKFEDLFENKNRHVFDQICVFLGVGFNSDTVDFNKKSNQSSVPRFIFLRNLIYRPSRFKKWLGRLIFSSDLKLRIAMWLDKINTVPEPKMKSQSWADEVAVSIHERLLTECQQLSSLTGINVDDWVAFHHSAIDKKGAQN